MIRVTRFVTPFDFIFRSEIRYLSAKLAMVFVCDLARARERLATWAAVGALDFCNGRASIVIRLLHYTRFLWYAIA